MDKRDHDFRKRLLATFEVEAREHIRAMSSGLLELENTTAGGRQSAIIEAIFREAHSLKGAARAVNLGEIEAICQVLESVLAALKRQEIAVSAELCDTLHQTLDSLGPFLLTAEEGPIAPDTSQLRAVLKRLESLPKTALIEPQMAEVPEWTLAPNPAPPSPPLAETVRVATATLDALLLQAEELLAVKLTTRQRAADLREVSTSLAAWQSERTKLQPAVGAMQRSLERADQQNGQAGLADGAEKSTARIRQLLDFLAWQDGFIKALDSRLTTLAQAAEWDHRAVSRMVDDLLQEMKRVSMLPFSSLLEIVPKLVRDLARDRGKEVAVVTRGGDIEIDRRILEEMKDPLIHVVRNCIDHGIEAPQERERQHKPRCGTITIAMTQEGGGKVELLITDDGVGIDAAGVKAAARKRGIVTADDAAALDEREALALVFHSGVSTSPMITEISGRGLGLAIVREKVEKLGGVISVDTVPGIQTAFRMILPLTLATFRGVLVQVAEHLLVLPTTYVERVLRINHADIQTVQNRATLQLNGQAIALVRLAEALELSHRHATDTAVDHIPVVVLTAAGQRIAFRVDAVLDEQEVLVKRLGPQLLRVRNVTGATVLGTGQVVPVLNVLDVMKSALRASSSSTAGSSVVTPIEREEATRKSVLVVEDSITARMLLRNLLEAAGYRVRTAFDGVDGLTQLRSGGIDIVVSDVDMPRMNGFALTAKIRSDKQFADLPVVLVTALESRADRERGVEVGANAYLVKSSFDQSDLLEVLQRLV